MDQLLHFSPNPVTFEYTPSRQTTTILNLRNTSQHRVAYKVKTSKPERYGVRPTAAILEPHAQLEVKLTQQALNEEADKIKNCQDRFLLQFARLDLFPEGETPGNFHGYQSASDLWNAIPNQIVQKTKFGVILKEAQSSKENRMGKKHSFDTDSKPRPTLTTYSPTDYHIERSDNSSANDLVGEAISTDAPRATIGTEVGSKGVSRIHEEAQETQETLQSSFPLAAAVSTVTTGPGAEGAESLGAHTEDSKNQKNDSDQIELSNGAQNEIHYASMEYTRERVRAIRTAPKIALLNLDEPSKQRVAVERAGELVRTIDARQDEIDKVNQDLCEARHRLQDATAATAPAYDVKYEVSESSRVPYAQIAIMAIISGAILQLLV